MTRSNGRKHQDVMAFVYAGLCFVVAASAFVGVMILAPTDGAAGAGSSASAPTLVAGATTPVVAPSASPTSNDPGPIGPSVTPVASPTRASFQIDLYRPGAFVSQMNKDYCTAGAIQNMLNVINPTFDTSTARQQEIGNIVVSLTTYEDSRNGGFGPNGWALAMNKLGGGPYKLVVDATFDKAMRDAALALAQTGRPVGLLTWWGAHSWVMTGFKADSDPALFPTTFKLKGAYIMDPYYPRLSSIWGQTLGPDSYRDMTAMAHNFIGWKRPEGSYPGRDGKWLLVVPVEASAPSTSATP
ncbi:MAG TPA: hypothetical protein VF337_04970 [Candidatus Limnocylindrales bacterium]